MPDLSPSRRRTRNIALVFAVAAVVGLTAGVVGQILLSRDATTATATETPVMTESPTPPRDTQQHVQVESHLAGDVDTSVLTEFVTSVNAAQAPNLYTVVISDTTTPQALADEKLDDTPGGVIVITLDPNAWAEEASPIGLALSDDVAAEYGTPDRLEHIEEAVRKVGPSNPTMAATVAFAQLLMPEDPIDHVH